MASFHIDAFNKKVQVMNQIGGKTLLLSAHEARSLHAEIYDLLSKLAAVPTEQVVNTTMDGGKF